MCVLTTKQIQKMNTPTCCKYCKEECKQRLKSCGACRKVFYCNTDCQRADWKVHKESCDKLFIVTYTGKIEDVKGNTASFKFEEIIGKKEKKKLLENKENISDLMEKIIEKYHDQKFSLKRWYCKCGNLAIGVMSRPINCAICVDLAKYRMSMIDLLCTPCCRNCVSITIVNMQAIGEHMEAQMPVPTYFPVAR